MLFMYGANELVHENTNSWRELDWQLLCFGQLYHGGIIYYYITSMVIRYDIANPSNLWVSWHKQKKKIEI